MLKQRLVPNAANKFFDKESSYCARCGVSSIRSQKAWDWQLQLDSGDISRGFSVLRE